MPAAHEPTAQTRRVVENMSAYGIPQEDIANVLDIDRKTLAKYYRAELDTATAKANAKVAETLYKQATDPQNPRSATCGIFWLKTRGGWKETSVHEHTGKDGNPIQTEDMTARDILANRLAGVSSRLGKSGDTGGTD